MFVITPRISTTLSLNFVAKSRHKHKARFRQQQPLPSLRHLVEKQRAQLAAAGVIVTENSVGNALWTFTALFEA